MRHVLFVLALSTTLSVPAHAQSAAANVAKDAARGSGTARLSIEALCAQLTPAEVAAIVGRNFQPKADAVYQVCKYADSQDKQRVRYFSLGNSILKEAAWRKFVETSARGKVVERDGVLVSHLRNNKFGTDSVWFKDRKGHALELHVNSGITEEQAVALTKAAME